MHLCLRFKSVNVAVYWPLGTLFLLWYADMLNPAFHLLLRTFVCFITFWSLNNCNADLIVDNFSESGGGAYGLNSNFFGFQSVKVAQQFNTGGRDVRLNSVAVQIFRASQVSDFTAEIWSADSLSNPDSVVGTLTLANNPTRNTFDRYHFRANGQINLDGQSDYFFSVKDNSTGNSILAGSVFGSNNYTGFGNIIENVRLQQTPSSPWIPFGSNAILIEMVGNPEPGSLLTDELCNGWLADEKTQKLTEQSHSPLS